MTDMTCPPIAQITPQRRRRFHLHDWLSLYRQRRALSQLTQEQLADIGITRADARRESQRPVWDAPAHWFDC